MMEIEKQIITIIMVVIGTLFTRFIAFLLFPAGKETPQYIKYLGTVLPSAVLGMLVIYSYKDIELFHGDHGIPELLSGLLVVILQKYKKNMFLSIAGGTITYMILIQTIFA